MSIHGWIQVEEITITFLPAMMTEDTWLKLSISESLLKLNGRCWSEGTFIFLYYACLVKWLRHLLLDEDFARVTSVSKPEKLQHGSMLYVELQRKGTELSADSELSWPFIKQNLPLIAQLRSSGF